MEAPTTEARSQGLRLIESFPALPSASGVEAGVDAEADGEALLYETAAASVEMSGGGAGDEDGDSAPPALCLPRGALQVTSRRVASIRNAGGDWTFELQMKKCGCM